MRTLDQGRPSIAAQDLNWRTARRSGGNGACVEVATPVGRVAVRDSEQPHGTIMRLTPGKWTDFVRRVKTTNFDTLMTRGTSPGRNQR